MHERRLDEQSTARTAPRPPNGYAVGITALTLIAELLVGLLSPDNSHGSRSAIARQRGQRNHAAGTEMPIGALKNPRPSRVILAGGPKGSLHTTKPEPAFG